jgi:DNA invertase Pin-like site-specific DNA recombinase
MVAEVEREETTRRRRSQLKKVRKMGIIRGKKEMRLNS